MLVLEQHSKNSALLVVLLALLLTRATVMTIVTLCAVRGKSGPLGDARKRAYPTDLGWG